MLSILHSFIYSPLAPQGIHEKKIIMYHLLRAYHVLDVLCSFLICLILTVLKTMYLFCFKVKTTGT